MVHRRYWVLPDQDLLGHERSEITMDRSHVAVRKLEPRAGKRVRELLWVLVKAPRDLLVGRIQTQRKVRGQHGRHVLLRFVVSVGNRCSGAFCFPLRHTGWALCQLPFVFEQVLEEVVAPLRRRLRPGDLRAAGYGVGADARAMLALPAEALILERGTFRFRADQRRIARAVRLAEAVATGNQRD